MKVNIARKVLSCYSNFQVFIRSGGNMTPMGVGILKLTS